VLSEGILVVVDHRIQGGSFAVEGFSLVSCLLLLIPFSIPLVDYEDCFVFLWLSGGFLEW
jgi:hypothetical protein